MESLTNLFRIGNGPSNSHTIASFHAAAAFKRFLPSGAASVGATLGGFLALMGLGHMSQKAIVDVLVPPHTLFSGALRGNEVVLTRHCASFSLGGGEITSTDDDPVNGKDIHSFRALAETLKDGR
ncbi:MAG: hypothetical protein LKG11_07320 [Bacilli bacterium]|jgi:hypothetical protein|nr:hypothetical protein [Bacilli bacterium]